VLLRFALIPNYGSLDILAGLFSVVIGLAAVAVAALTVLLSFIVTCNPEVSRNAKGRAWVAAGIPWLIFATL